MFIRFVLCYKRAASSRTSPICDKHFSKCLFHAQILQRFFYRCSVLNVSGQQPDVWGGTLRRWNTARATRLQAPPWRRPHCLCKRLCSLANWATLLYTQQTVCFSFRILLSNYDNGLVKTNVNNNNITIPFKDLNFQLLPSLFFLCWFSSQGSIQPVNTRMSAPSPKSLPQPPPQYTSWQIHGSG